jgi:antitoxin component YwqK of YwqJK toxin-antitoxin module
MGIQDSRNNREESKMTLIGFIDFFLNIDNKNSNEKKYVYRGIVCEAPSIVKHIPGLFKEQKDWSNEGRMVFLGSEYWSILTYCEGDITLEMYTTKDYYMSGVKAASKFYKEN